jgi:diacylglycerol kinase family enzyme
MAQPLPVIINASGGTAAKLGDKLAGTIHAAFDKAGRGIALELVEGKDIAAAVQRHVGKRAVVVGGGDGTLGGAAGALADSRTSLGILPLGTRNHLALELGIPTDLAKAAWVAADGYHRQIDIGCAGKRVFVNNASLGIYTRLVREREARSTPKWMATIPAALATLRRWKAQGFDLIVDRRRQDLRTPLLFIGNNRYSFAKGEVGARESLSDGVLSLYAVAAQRPLGLAAFAARAMAGHADPSNDFEIEFDAKRIVVDGKGPIDVALDGEVLSLPRPVVFKTLPGALSVIVPEPQRAPKRSKPNR